MRLVILMVLAGLVASPLSASAQDTDKGWVEEFYPELAPRESPQAPPPEPVPKEPVSEPAPEEPALQLKLDDAGVEVVPPPPRKPDGYTLMEMELRVSRAKIGLGVSAGVLAVGFGMGFAAVGGSLCLSWDDPSPCPEPWAAPVGITGAVLGVGGLVGVIANGVMLGQRKRALSELRQAHYGVPTRTPDGYTLEEMELRVKRVRIGLGVSAGVVALAVGLLVAGTVGECRYGSQLTLPSYCDPLLAAGTAFMFAGIIGMTTTGFMSLKRKRHRNRLTQAHHGTPRRVQWDLARSRLVF
jgi:hypothetical protein